MNLKQHGALSGMGFCGNFMVSCEDGLLYSDLCVGGITTSSY